MIGLFNSREIATAFWLLVLLIFAFRHSGIRNSVLVCLRTFCHHKILVTVFLLLIYVVVLIFCLRAIGIWHIGLLKDSIIWFLFSAIVLMVRYVSAKDSENLFRKYLTDSIKIIIVFNFLINTYTYSLPIELVFVPFVALIVTIDDIASMKKEYVAKRTNVIVAGIGLIIIIVALFKAVMDYNILVSFDTLRKITLAPLLAMLMFPFIYVLLVLCEYERIFNDYNFAIKKTKQLKRYFQRKLILYSGFNLKRLQNINMNGIFDLIYIAEEKDVDRFIAEASQRYLVKKKSE